MWEAGKSVTDVLKGNDDMVKEDPSLANVDIVEEDGI
jgi:hypothetical protein